MTTFIIILVMPGVCFIPYEITASSLEAATAAAQGMADKFTAKNINCYAFATPKQAG